MGMPEMGALIVVRCAIGVAPMALAVLLAYGHLRRGLSLHPDTRFADSELAAMHLQFWMGVSCLVVFSILIVTGNVVWLFVISGLIACIGLSSLVWRATYPGRPRYAIFPYHKTGTALFNGVAFLAFSLFLAYVGFQYWR